MPVTNVLMSGLPNGIVLRLEFQVQIDDAPGINDQPGTKYRIDDTSSEATLVPVNGIGQVDSTFWAAWKAANPTSDLLTRGALLG